MKFVNSIEIKIDDEIFYKKDDSNKYFYVCYREKFNIFK